jgi:putative addiction module component (TIGR02574 family)
MSPNLTTVLAAAESLRVAERRELIELLLQGLDETAEGEGESETPVLSEAWRQEITRRLAEYDAGQADTVSWEEIQARWQERRAKGG